MQQRQQQRRDRSQQQQQQSQTTVYGYSIADWKTFSEDQRRAAQAGKPVYDFSPPDMMHKIKVLAIAFIGVGAMFIVTGAALLAVELPYNTTGPVISMMYGVTMLGAALVVAGAFMFALFKHPQWAPGIKWGMLVFCIATGIFCFIATGLAGETVFTDILQVVVIWYALSVIIKQGKVPKQQ